MDFRHYGKVYAFMCRCAGGDAHEIAHARRVACNAVRIAKGEGGLDLQVVILAALLHDIGRGEGTNDHAAAGSAKARAFLLESGYSEKVAEHVAECIASHSLASGPRPHTGEAKVLFDADKLDLTGAVGTARVIGHCARAGEPLYALDENGLPGLGKKGEPASLFREYRKKLRKLPAMLFTATARKMADKNQRAMDDFMAALAKELKRAYTAGAGLFAGERGNGSR